MYFLILAFLLFLNPQMKCKNKDQLRSEINSSYYTFNTSTLELLLSECEKGVKKNDDWIWKYYAGLLHYNLGKIYYIPNPDKAYDHFDVAVDYFDECVESNPSPENIALLSASYGKKSSLNSLYAIVYGIKAKNRIVDAYNIDKDNPKVLLIAATHLMHTPAAFGGDKDKAELFLKKALKILNEGYKFKAESVIWGDKPEILAYLAQLEIIKGNFEEARKYMQDALTIIPDYGFVKIDLKDQISKLEANKPK